jgi:glutaredoxin
MEDKPMNTPTPQAVGQAGMRFYWQPGCSSCVKVKELLTEMGVEFTSVNILEDPDGLQELMARGARSVPVLTRGDEMIFTQSLEDVAKFVGKSRQVNRLPPADLFARWQYFLDTAVGLIRQIPEDKLHGFPIEKRNRTVSNLAYHIFQVPEGVMAMVEGRTGDSRDYDNAIYDHLRTKDEILAYARGVIAAHRQWWAATDQTGQKRVATYYGEQPLHQILERGTWHSAQHTRQLNHVLDSFDVPVEKPIAAGAYDGLPMPKAIWA